MDLGGLFASSAAVRRSRLKEEMLALLDDSFLQYRKSLALSSFKFHKPPAHPNCTEWLGGQ